MARHARLHGTRIGVFRGIAALALLCGCTSGPDASELPVLFPPPPEVARVCHLDTLHSSAQVDSGPGFWYRLLIGTPPPPTEVVKPYGMAFSDGALFVCDTALKAVLVFDFKNHEFRMVGPGSLVSLRAPIGIALDDRGYKYVSDSVVRQILVYDELDRFRMALGNPLELKPAGLAFHEGRLYVCDLASQAVRVMDPGTGETLAWIGNTGEQAERLSWPMGVAVAPDGSLAVTDMLQCRVAVYGPGGQRLRFIGSIGKLPGQFVRPKGIAVDSAGRIHVVDAAFYNVQIFSSEGRILMNYGGPGATAGQMVLPAGIAVSDAAAQYFQDRAPEDFPLSFVIFVANQYGPRKVQVFGFREVPDPGAAEEVDEETPPTPPAGASAEDGGGDEVTGGSEED